MLKKYAYFSISYPTIARIDVEIKVRKDISNYDNSVFDLFIIPIVNRFIESGIDVSYDSTYLHNKHRKSEYIGSNDEVTLEILNNSELASESETENGS